MRRNAATCDTSARAHTGQDEGQSVIEYALIVGMLSIVIAVVLAGTAPDWITRATAGVATALTTAGL